MSDLILCVMDIFVCLSEVRPPEVALSICTIE